MIQDKEKVKKIYNYLANLAQAHKSSSHKHYGWSLYNKKDKKRGFSVRHYFQYDNSCKNTSFELYDIDFNYKSGFFSDSDNYKRIYINIRISKDFSELEIEECLTEDEANLVEFFKKLDKMLENYKDVEATLTQILLSKVEE